jgi:hypothetical protein
MATSIPSAAPESHAQHALNDAVKNANISTLSAEKYSALLQRTATRVRSFEAAGQTKQAAMLEMLLELGALNNALEPGGSFAQAFTTELTKAINAKLSDAQTHIPAAQIARGVEGILKNRQRDAAQSVVLLSDDVFLADLDAFLAAGPQAGHSHAQANQKLNEIIVRFTQISRSQGAEPPIHVMASDVGHHIFHKALAEVFTIHGPLVAPLERGMAPHWPGGCPTKLEHAATAWLHDRFHAAQMVTSLTNPATGEAMQESIKQAVAAQDNTLAQQPTSKVVTPPAHHEQALGATLGPAV